MDSVDVPSAPPSSMNERSCSLSFMYGNIYLPWHARNNRYSPLARDPRGKGHITRIEVVLVITQTGQFFAYSPYSTRIMGKVGAPRLRYSAEISPVLGRGYFTAHKSTLPIILVY